MLLNIAILEDDPKQSKELYKLLTTWAACHGHVFHIYQYTNGPSLLRAITQQTFHACFLDIQWYHNIYLKDFFRAYCNISSGSFGN